MTAVEAVAAWQRETWYQGAQPIVRVKHDFSGLEAAQNGNGQGEECKRRRLKRRAAPEEDLAATDNGDSEPSNVADRVEESVAMASREGDYAAQPYDSDAAPVAAAPLEACPYLCTGYDCYVVQEPCAMCAMALVHSRVRRVVFCQPDKQHGFLGGCGVRLHSKRSLNHHFQVYRLPLLTEDALGPS